ncbi:hypothetical protein BGZ74_011705 [Mortierella antarctica]|nr:hypothetical protein BGZ74_011705 [Mortierella antarctica]
MRKSLSLLTLGGLLAAIGSAAPVCFDSTSRQDVFADVRYGHSLPSDNDGGIIYLPPRQERARVDLDAMMKNLISREMQTTYNAAQYVESLKEKICNQGTFLIVNCKVEILDRPVIKVIPTEQVSKDIVCTTETCMIGLEETVTVSTTHSAEVSLSIEAGAKPFGIGMSFTTTVGYGFSSTAEASTTLVYNFDLVRGDTGYIGMVNAQVSARVRVTGCKCPTDFPDGPICQAVCIIQGDTFTEIGHHEAVILKNRVPRAYVAFVYTN